MQAGQAGQAGQPGQPAQIEQTLFIKIDGSESKPHMDAAYATLQYFSGHTPVVIYNQSKKAQKELGRAYWVKLSDTLLAELRERFGVENVALRRGV